MSNPNSASSPFSQYMRDRHLSKEKNGFGSASGGSSSSITNLPSINNPSLNNRQTHTNALNGSNNRPTPSGMKAPELLQVIESQRRELQARTDSVNAIQRNFERLSEMYRNDRAELERLREEMERLRERDAASESERKVLAAMREELESLLNSHKELRETREREREAFNNSSRDMEQKLEEQQSSFMELQRCCDALKSEAAESEEKLRRVNAELNDVKRKVVQFTLELKGRLMSLPIEGNNILSGITSTTANSNSNNSNNHHGVVDINNGSPSDSNNVSSLTKSLSDAWDYVDALCIAYKRLQMAKDQKIQTREKEAYEAVISNLIINSETMVRNGIYSEETSSREKMYAISSAALRDNEKKQEHQMMCEVQAQLNSANSEMNEQQEKYQTTVLTLERELTEVKRLLQSAHDENTALQQQQKEYQQQQQTASKQEIAELQLEMQRRETLIMEQWRTDKKAEENRYAELLEAARREGDVALKQQREALSQEYAEKEHLLRNRVESLERELQYQRDQHKEVEAEMRSSNTEICNTLTMRTAAILHNYFESLFQQENEVRYSLSLLEEKERDKIRLQHVYTLKEMKHTTSSAWTALTLSLRALETKEAEERYFILLEESCTTPIAECERSIFALRLVEERRMVITDAKLSQCEPLKLLRLQVQQLRKDTMSITSSLNNKLQECWRLSREGMKYTQQLQLLHADATANATATAAALSLREAQEEQRQQQQQIALAAIERLIAAEEASESTFSCGQCFQLCKRPVTCVPCGHTFCESCLLQHPQNKKRAVGNVCSYYCPECGATTCNALLRVRALESLSGNFGFRRKEVEEIRRALEKLSQS